MVNLKKSTINQLTTLLHKKEPNKIDGALDELIIPQKEEIAPNFLLEFTIDKLRQDSSNAFWWTPRLIVVNKLIVGMCGFKSTPKADASVEIGYGIIPSQQRRGFATHAVELLLKEAFSTVEIQTVLARTVLSNYPSQRVLEKNGFNFEDSKIDPDDGEVLIWRKIK